MTHLNESTLNEYLDSMLTVDQQREVETHLALCPECRVKLTELQQLFVALAEVKELPLTVDLSARVLAGIRADAASMPWLRPLLGMQLAVVAIMLGFLWPSLQNGLGKVGTAVNATLSALQPIQISVSEQLAGLQTAVLTQLQAPSLPLELAAAQWGLLITLAFAAWLAGNRLLFVNEQ